MIKKLVSIVLCITLCTISTLMVSADSYQVNKQQDSINVLVDDAQTRSVIVIMDGIQSTATYDKKSGDLTITSQGKTTKIKGNTVKKASIQTLTAKDISIMSAPAGYKAYDNESVFDIGYKIYKNSKTKKYYWEVDGPGWWNGFGTNETTSNADDLKKYAGYVDKSAEYWGQTKGLLISAGAAGFVGIVLALLPEPVASKGAAVAALVAAGASAGAATCAGGSYYNCNKYYHKAVDFYNDNL